jgi:hypothetical protein
MIAALLLMQPAYASFEDLRSFEDVPDKLVFFTGWMPEVCRLPRSTQPVLERPENLMKPFRQALEWRLPTPQVSCIDDYDSLRRNDPLPVEEIASTPPCRDQDCSTVKPVACNDRLASMPPLCAGDRPAASAFDEFTVERAIERGFGSGLERETWETVHEAPHWQRIASARDRWRSCWE